MEKFKFFIRLIITIVSVGLFTASYFFKLLPLGTVTGIIPSICLLYIILFQNPKPAKKIGKTR